MKRKELIDIVKNHIESFSYKNSSLDIKISNSNVLKIIKFIEKKYHEQLFTPSKTTID
jgi:hypothetical protein